MQVNTAYPPQLREALLMAEATPTGNVSSATSGCTSPPVTLSSALARRPQCPSGWSMTQELRADGATDTSYYTRDTGRRLNSQAAVLRYLRVRSAPPLPSRPPPTASCCSALLLRPLPSYCAHSGAGRVQGVAQRGCSGGDCGSWVRGRAGVALLARRRAHMGASLARVGTEGVRCSGAPPVPAGASPWITITITITARSLDVARPYPASPPD